MILQNQVHCNRCGESPYSAHRHDFRTCGCGNVSVDGGMDYLRRVFVSQDFVEMSVDIPDAAAKAAMEAITEATNTGRNELGILCAVARALRDNGVKLDVVA